MRTYGLTLQELIDFVGLREERRERTKSGYTTNYLPFPAEYDTSEDELSDHEYFEQYDWPHHPDYDEDGDENEQYDSRWDAFWEQAGDKYERMRQKYQEAIVEVLQNAIEPAQIVEVNGRYSLILDPSGFMRQEYKGQTKSTSKTALGIGLSRVSLCPSPLG